MVLASVAHIAIVAALIAFGVVIGIWGWKKPPWWTETFRNKDEDEG